MRSVPCFFFNDTATTEIYTLSLHDALPIFAVQRRRAGRSPRAHHRGGRAGADRAHLPVPLRRRPEHRAVLRSEEHTSELQSRQYLVCRLLLEKKTSTYKILWLRGLHHPLLT